MRRGGFWLVCGCFGSGVLAVVATAATALQCRKEIDGDESLKELEDMMFMQPGLSIITLRLVFVSEMRSLVGDMRIEACSNLDT